MFGSVSNREGWSAVAGESRLHRKAGVCREGQSRLPLQAAPGKLTLGETVPASPPHILHVVTLLPIFGRDVVNQRLVTCELYMSGKVRLASFRSYEVNRRSLQLLV